MGIVRGDGIVAVAADVVGAVDRRCSTTSSATTASSSRCITGVDADDGRRRRRSRRGWPTHRPGVEVEVHDGGQPLYPYLFGVE